MKAIFKEWTGQKELTRVDRITLHMRCLVRDHKYAWHLAGGARQNSSATPPALGNRCGRRER